MKKNRLYYGYDLHCLIKTFRVMRITAFLLLFAVFQAFAGNSYSQDTRLSLEFSGKKLVEAMDEIEEQTEFYFLYNEKLVDTDRIVSLSVKNQKIDKILDKLFSNTDVVYTITDRKIILAPSFLWEVQQQGKTVSGKVTDQSGEPIPGASIVMKGTTTGTISDMDGNFTLAGVPGDATLVFSFVGMTTQEIPVGNQSSFNIVMEEGILGLDEVVVVGYGTQKKVNMTGSITSVKTDDLQNIPASNLSNTLAGRAPGVTITGTSGLAGASSSIRIRGSFGDPLYVINGVIQDKADFDALDANEVESINFLKDAASAAIYGSQAGNGVVLVTTKSGIIQKPKFNYKGSYSTSRTTKPVQSYTATEELRYVNNMNITRGQEAPYGSDIFDYFKDKSYDINDLIWQDPSVQQHNLSVNGGTETITYYLSLGYHGENGSYHNTDYEKYNFRSDVTAHITKRFKVNVNLSGNQRNYNRWYWPYDGAEDFNVGDWYRATFNWSRLYPFYVDEQGNPTNDPNDVPIKTPGGYHPPEIMLHGGYRDNTYRTFDGIIRFDLDLGEYIDGLTTSIQGHLDANDRNMKSFVLHNKWYIFQPASAGNQFIPGPVDFTQVGTHNLSASYNNIQEVMNYNNSYQLNWYLNYDKTFGMHNISAVAVYEQSEWNGKSLNGRAEDLLSTSIDQIFNASSDTERRWFSGSEGETAQASWIGRANYAYADKYIAEFSFRYDGNYRFAPNDRWGFFPSFSAGWRISEEAFMDNLTWLSNLKLRGSYGSTGSIKDVNANDIAPWRWTNNYTKTTGFVFGSSYYDGLTPGSVPNPDITWATLKMWNIGLEYGLLQNKLRGEFDVWSKEESDILATRLGSTPTTFGASLPSVNYAQRSWNGIEISASWSDHIGELKYDVYGNMGYSKDQWDIFDEPESYTDGTYQDNWRSIIGKPKDRIGGYISKGIIRTQEQLNAIPDGFTQFGREPMLGVLLFEDIRGDNYSEGPDGKIDGNDWTYLSDNGSPRINFGFGFNLEWRGLAVNTHFQGVGAYDRLVSTRNGGGVFQVDRPYFELWADDYWTPETPNATYPRINGGWMQPEFGGGPSSFWMKDGSFVRLKNLNIAYTLPQQWYQNLGIEDVQLFVNGTNLFVISSFKEYDPEQATLDSYPLMKTFTGGLSINF